MPKKPYKMSIKARILGILIMMLLLSLAGHLGIFYYSTSNVKSINQQAINEIFNFENKANQELKDSVMNKFVIMNIRTYTEYIDRKVRQSRPGGIDLAGRAGKGTGVKEDAEKAISRVIDLQHLLEVEKFRPGYMFIIDGRGRIIATEGSPEGSIYNRYFSHGMQLLDSRDRTIAAAVQSILDAHHEFGVARMTVDGNIYFLPFSRIESINCTLVEIVPESYLNSQVTVISDKIGRYTATIRNNFISLYNRINFITLAVFFTIIVIAYWIGLSLSKTFTTPLLKLKEATRHIGRGNLVEKISLKTGDEIEELADRFNMMTDDLQAYIQRLSESIAREKTIEEEIKLAAHIQTSSLPESSPSFAPGAAVALSAFIKPTKIVSGDFYDYFFTDENRLFFAIGDVSGKSISAALFMMTTKILMKRFALMNLSPEEVLKNVNDTLALDNPTCMYSTVFCGVLDTGTGAITYCNGGHTSPLVFDGASFRYLEIDENMLVGLTPKAEFRSETITLNRKDMLFLYSDGVTESKNAAGELYSEQRLLDVLNRCDKDDTCAAIGAIKEDVLAFSKDAEQYDDITMLCIKSGDS
jgi:sigma-B regulation protein RsbU (phosphoserine phosphatase)